MTSTSAARQPRRFPAAITWVIKILVSAGLLYYLFTQDALEPAKIKELARTASVGWLAVALGLYGLMIVVSSWRWRLLLDAQHVPAPFEGLLMSFLVATFFNNFLPSNIGGDVVRIRDTAKAAGSKTLAATIVLVDRGIGLIGLVLVAAAGATLTARSTTALGPVGPGILWAVFAAGTIVAIAVLLMPQSVGLLLRPLRALHQEWVGRQIERLTTALAKFRQSPVALIGGVIASVTLQLVLVAFYAAIARALHMSVSTHHLALVVPLSFIVQMLPVSVNGLGVRETLFASYFKLLGESPGDGTTLSLASAVLIMLFSVSGAIAYIARRSGLKNAYPVGETE